MSDPAPQRRRTAAKRPADAADTVETTAAPSQADEAMADAPTTPKRRARATPATEPENTTAVSDPGEQRPARAPRRAAAPAREDGDAPRPRRARASREPAAESAAEPGGGDAATVPAPSSGNGDAPRGYAKPTYAGLRQRYHDDIAPALLRQFGYPNVMQIPRLEKVVVNIGLGEAIQNAKAIDAAVGDLATITGQKPIVTRAKRSIAQFRVRTGMPIGAKVTLRGQRMYDFFERTVRLALPRIRDFRGIPTRSFDGRGNFTLGIREQLVYPEIDYDRIDRLRGLEISIVTTARTDEEGRRLLELLGMPFQAN